MANTISSVTSNVAYANQARKRAEGVALATSDNTASPPSDKVSLNQSNTEDATQTYTDPRSLLRAARPDLATMLEDSEREVARFMEQLRGVIDEQGLNWNKVFSGEQKLTAKPEEIEAAKQAIADDGEWGVRKTAERILNFALFTAGGDPEKLEKVRAAVQSGFDSAREELGGKLPEISENTYKTVMAEFDRWQQEGLPTSSTVSLATPTTKA
ncbi:hypothetical protein [Chitinimonas sp. BJB300]|uniref:hypothetical protein n=1 Tax=Chitinimonas sp. BJB300 TaxID=1559339 RepID=UPI000C0FEC44|nr:hypothetical protein [Chitinimonas sp. BJB300]PHV09842.1 hypothetical protein CSQ89_19460 [Chitinimonas sp. BJB300]TSJ91022.1 hypothetical protein FG002_001550 [Chitinimonas sp. BJB300]